MLFVQRRPALLTDSYLAIASHFMPDPHRTARRTHQGHVRQPNRPLLLGNSTLDVALRIRPHVLLHRHHVLHQHLALVGKHAQHAPFFSRIPPGHHLHGVIPADIHSLVFGRYCSHRLALPNLSIGRDGPCRVSTPALKHFRRQRHNLQKFLLAQFARHRTKYSRAHRFSGFVDQHGRILIETDVSPIPPPMLFPRPHNDRLHHFALLHLAVRRSFLHACRDHVAKPGSQTGRAAERQDHLQLARAGVIGDLEHGSHHYGHVRLLLRLLILSGLSYQLYRPTPVPASTSTSGTSVVFRTISFSVQRFSFDNGRDSSIRTTSPECASFFSSCA